MSLSDEFNDVKDKINQAISQCDVILAGGKVQEVEYIESTGTQYINTKITTNSNISVELCAQCSISNSTGYFIGGTDGGEKNRYGFRSYSDGRLYFYTASTGWPNTTVTMTSKHIYKTEKYILYVDGTKKITATSTAFTGSYYMYLFANNDGGNIIEKLPAKLYYCKIWNGSELVRDFVPAINGHGVGCLFDKVSQTVFDNIGSGNFIAGPRV